MEPVSLPLSHTTAITGLGLVSPLGISVGETWDALLANRFIREHSTVAEFTGPNRSIAMALQASREAIQHAKWTSADLSSPDTALFIGTSKGPIESWICGELGAAGLGHINESLARTLGFGSGIRMTLSAACASGLHALARAAMALASGEAARALVVGVEASVHPLFLSSFKRLGVLAKPEHGCRPFDQTRAGFLMSEAAGAICLENESRSEAIARVSGFAIGGDATHLTGGDPAGKTLRRLLSCIIGQQSVDLVHAHSTGTVVSDPIELAAIESTLESACESTRPVLYSHKAALGHSLGAAGILSIIINCLCHKHAVVPGNPRSHSPIPMRQVKFSTEPIALPIRRSLALASGFGGPIAVVGLVSRFPALPGL